jgi:hypothetical protein
MQNATINQLTSGGHKSIPGEHLPQAWRLKFNHCNANATVDQLTSGGHKSIPGEHLPQDLAPKNQLMQCRMQQSIS